ncbi:hypothetical protein BDB00DRAFT_876809 [Zychaea mexicana]|uniref:uncharacterized protein n=1 Tax=Zychaea mexicana TaxID=64656 RepID=UPI0022FE0087|nr:uncharacterized protein BDB00DRAFT_876809 [Zychaea mexicana]KAI9489027.1 hypothetical protein BDB00DRAFT_876809 [Zychaea mexicana]
MTATRSASIYKAGELVAYKPLEGIEARSQGTIQEVLTKPKQGIGGKVMGSATADHPCYYITNERTGKTTLIRHAAVVERVNNDDQE